MTKRYWYPRFVRDLASDFDYLDKLSAEDRAWLERFRDEYYNAASHDISSDDQLREADRAKKRAKRDLFSYGLRADGTQLEYLPSEPTCTSEDLERPEVLAILEELRTLRPGLDDADARKRARFSSVTAERRFFELRTRLSVLLGDET